jgi:hypothetical protein
MGVLYGAYHQSRLAKREVGIRAIEAEKKAIRDAKAAEDKKRAVEGEQSSDSSDTYDSITNVVLQRKTEPLLNYRSHRSKVSSH